METAAMMHHFGRTAVAVLLFGAAGAWAADAKFTVKPATTPPPKELKDPFRQLLADKSVQLLDAKGSVVCEVWYRKDVPVEATPEQIKNGLSYRELKETTVLGAVRFDQPWTDYRKQKIKPGVYTLRLGFQPQDGDHMGTAPYQEFCLLVSADRDRKPDLLPVKDLQELSTKSIGTSHPAVLLLFPNEKPKDMPQLVGKDNDHWVLNTKEDVTVGGKKVPAGLGIGLTLIGHAE
jgi:hypothetical protein